MKDTYEAFGMGEGRQREEGDESDSPHDEGSVEFVKRCWKQRERLLSRLAITIDQTNNRGLSATSRDNE